MRVMGSAQKQALAEHVLKAFKARLAAHVREVFPSETAGLSDAALEVTVTAAMQRAKDCGVTDEEDVQRFLECVFRYGPHFDTDPATAWAGAILRDERLCGATKMDRICAHEPTSGQ